MSPKGTKRPKLSAFQRGIVALKNAEGAFGNIQLKDPEAKFMAPILEKLEQFRIAIEKKDPSLIDDDLPTPPVAPEPDTAAESV